MMFKPALAALFALSFAAPALAADRCSVPKEEWKTEAELTDKLKAEGWEIKKVKIDDGCYEVYAIDKEGKKREEYFDPKTLEMLKAAGDDSKSDDDKTSEEKKEEPAKK